MIRFEQLPVEPTWWQVALDWAANRPLVWAAILAALLVMVLIVLVIRHHRSWSATQERERQRHARQNQRENDRIAAGRRQAETPKKNGDRDPQAECCEAFGLNLALAPREGQRPK